VYPIWLLGWSGPGTKKTQTAVIAAILLLSALLLTTAVVVLNNTGGYFGDVHRTANGSHTLLQFESGLHDPEAVHAWWSGQEGVETSSLFRYVSLSQAVHEGKEIANLTFHMTNAGPGPLASPVDRLIFAERESPSPAPEAGTVWIPTSLAYSKSIGTGDRLAFEWADKTFVYRVSAIVVDLPFSQPFTVTARIWMNESDYAGLLAAGGAIHSSVAHLDPPEWGYDDAHISVQVVNGAASPDEVDRALRAHPWTEHVGRFGYVYGVPAETAENARLSGIPVTFTDGDPDRLGYETLLGRHPATGSEIALGVRAAELLGKRIGDEVRLYIRGIQASYTVTGIYQGIPNMSLSARMTTDGVPRLAPGREPDAPAFFLLLKEGADRDAFIAELRERFGDAIYAASQETLLRETFDQAAGILIWPLAAMGLFIAGVAYGIMYSVVRVQLKRDARTLGIFRSLGMTAGRLRLALLSGAALPTFAGLLPGLLAGTLLMPKLLEAVLRAYGIVEFPAVRDAGALATAVAAGWAAILGGCWLASSDVKRQSLRSLVEEG
jgi:hypothetical protein